MAGGLPASDLRPKGHTPTETRALLAAQGSSAADFQPNVRLCIDAFDPGLMAAVLIFADAKLAH
jgi:hypothetical protein